MFLECLETPLKSIACTTAFPVAKLDGDCRSLARNTEMMGMSLPSTASGQNPRHLCCSGYPRRVEQGNRRFRWHLIWKQNVEKGDAFFTAAVNYVADDGEGKNSQPHKAGS